MPERFLGRTLGKYRIEALLGTGGFAWVYQALDPDLGIRVAVKVLKPQFAGDPEFEARFRREASTAARLRHPNIITIYAVGREQDAVYFAMDCLPNSLAGRLGVVTALPGPMVVRIALDVASALGYAHREGIVHRDVKPDNVLFDEHGNAIVADFGIARAVDAHAADTGTRFVVGTPHYFAPEQARGRPIDGRADLYALGVTLYRAAAGVLPFPGDDWFEVAKQHVEREPADVRTHAPALSTELARIIHRLLEKDPADRFASAEELHEALLQTPEHGEPAAVRTVAVPALDRIWTTTGITARRRRLRRRVLAGTGIVAAAALVGALVQSRAGTAAATLAADSSARGLTPPPVPAAPLPAAPPRDTAADSARTDTTARATPVRQVARLVLTGPDNARLLFNRRSVGFGQWSGRDLPPGRYVVAAELSDAPPGCNTARDQQVVSLGPGDVRTVELAPVGCGRMELNVSIDGRPVGVDRGARYEVRGRETREGGVPLAGPLVLPAGEYNVSISAPRCATFTATVRVSAGGTTAAPIKLLCQ